jgi:hypothetical protein
MSSPDADQQFKDDIPTPATANKATKATKDAPTVKRGRGRPPKGTRVAKADKYVAPKYGKFCGHKHIPPIY